MPDVTISFTDAQWARLVTASSYIKRIDESGDIDTSYLSTLWKNQVSEWVQAYEKQKTTIEDF